MNKPLRLKKALAALLVAGVAIPALFQAAPVRAQDAAQNEKINLMVDAIMAKEEGNLSEAKAKIERLVALAPDDTGARELLNEINQAIAARTDSVVTSAPAIAPQPSSDAEKANLALAAAIAKENGDLATAKDKAEQLVALAPNDTGARELLDEINRAILEKSTPPVATPNNNLTSGSAPAASPSAPVAPAKPLTPLEAAAQKNENLYSEVQDAMIAARQMADTGNTVGALKLIDKATEALNKNADNVGSQEYLSRLKRLRQDIAAGINAPGGSTEAVEKQARRAIEDLALHNARKKAEALELADQARTQIRAGQLDEAQATLDKATADLPRNTSTIDAQQEIRKTQSQLIHYRIENAVEARNMPEAERQLAFYGELNGKTDRGYLQLAQELAERKADPRYASINDLSPGYTAKEATINQLLQKGKALYLSGAYNEALRAFAEVTQYQPHNTTAQAYSIRIRKILSNASQVRGMTKELMLGAVDGGWLLPSPTAKAVDVDTGKVEEPLIVKRLKNTKIPTITLRDAPLSRAIDTLSELSVLYDPDQAGGVNMVVFDPDHKNPTVSISLRNATLERVLELVTKNANFSYTVTNDVVEIRPDIGSTGETETEFFSVTRTAVIRMAGISGGSNAQAPGGIFPPAGGGSGPVGGELPEEQGIKSFLQRSGIPFDIPGAALSYDGQGQLIITQTRRNLEKIRTILRRFYAGEKQVNIETKFLEVTEGALRQLSTNFVLTNGNKVANTNLRNLQDTFGARLVSNPGTIIVSGNSVPDGSGGTITTQGSITPIPNDPPAFPSGNNGPASPTYQGIIGHLGGYSVELIMSAIEQNEGSDLMAAPHLTVISGGTATIRIVQRLRYPETYGEIQSNVGSSSGGNFNGNSSGAGASVTITAGTPQDFTHQDIGVILEVAPKVSDDDLITLNLKPQVYEFEGFVEYGGTSVAIAGNTTVTVPSGFFQPIFSIREVATDVVMYDGATVVIGGLTREEVKTVSDKVPVLGDLPLVGSFFQSNGRSTTKRNLMIFVTANLVGPGGAPMKQAVEGVPANATFANPSVIAPSGPLNRGVPTETAEAASTTTQAK